MYGIDQAVNIILCDMSVKTEFQLKKTFELQMIRKEQLPQLIWVTYSILALKSNSGFPAAMMLDLKQVAASPIPKTHKTLGMMEWQQFWQMVESFSVDKEMIRRNVANYCPVPGPL